MGFLDEDLDLIEVLDRPALFSNGRIPREAVPEGFYAYDLYQIFATSHRLLWSTTAAQCLQRNPLISMVQTESI